MALSAVALLQPRMLFVASDREDPSSSAASRTPGLGVRGCYQVNSDFSGKAVLAPKFKFRLDQMLQTDWRRHFYNATAAYGRSKKTVYGLGTALSAPLLLGRERVRIPVLEGYR